MRWEHRALWRVHLDSFTDLPELVVFAVFQRHFVEERLDCVRRKRRQLPVRERMLVSEFFERSQGYKKTNFEKLRKNRAHRGRGVAQLRFACGTVRNVAYRRNATKRLQQLNSAVEVVSNLKIENKNQIQTKLK